MNVARDLVSYTLFFISGLILGYYTLLPDQFALFILSVLLIVLVVSYICFSRPYYKLILMLVFFFLGLFILDYQEADLHSLDRWAGQELKAGGTVKSVADNYLILEVNTVNKEQIKGKPGLVVYLSRRDSQPYRPGEQASFRGLLVKPLPATNPGGFSARDYWRQKGVGYQLNALSPGQVIGGARSFPVYVARLQDSIYRMIKENLPEREAGILLGLLLGDKDQMDKGFYEAAQKLGIAHVFAVSGLHVGLILAFFLVSCKLLKLPDLFILPGSLFLLAGYSLITGLTPSVVRASIMALLGLLSVKILKYRDFYTILAAAALLILLINPLSLFSISFQLSFVTTLGIVYLMPVVKKGLFFLPDKVSTILAVPVAAQLAALPLTVYYFNTLSLLAPFYNILLVPLVAFLIPLLFAALVLSFFYSGLAQPFILLAGGLTYGISGIITFLDRSLSGYLYLGSPAPVLIIGYYCLLAGLKEADRIKKLVPANLRYVVVLILIAVLTSIAIPGPPSLEIVFLDVGQGDGAVIKTPYNKYVVIDGGPGESTVAAYLKYRGVNKVALVVLSHPDHDHINGLSKVLEDFKTEVLLVPPDVADSEALAGLKSLAVQEGTQVIEGRPGMVLNFPSQTGLQVLSPDLSKIHLPDTNNTSLVINCTYRDQDFLFTGDIDKEVLYRLTPRLEDIEVIKIPHHGSQDAYSGRFYSRVKPDFAVISAGRGNRYGHPHSLVTDGLQKNGIRVYRTDTQGAVIIKTDGRSLHFDTMLENN
ncbi:MAG: DNA internalization-related competence protein ComEC/Rec2 [Peptococcaceae bacterium]